MSSKTFIDSPTTVVVCIKKPDGSNDTHYFHYEDTKMLDYLKTIYGRSGEKVRKYAIQEMNRVKEKYLRSIGKL